MTGIARGPPGGAQGGAGCIHHPSNNTKCRTANVSNHPAAAPAPPRGPKTWDDGHQRAAASRPNMPRPVVSVSCSLMLPQQRAVEHLCLSAHTPIESYRSDSSDSGGQCKRVSTGMGRTDAPRRTECARSICPQCSEPRYAPDSISQCTGWCPTAVRRSEDRQWVRSRARVKTRALGPHFEAHSRVCRFRTDRASKVGIICGSSRRSCDVRRQICKSDSRALGVCPPLEIGRQPSRARDLSSLICCCHHV